MVSIVARLLLLPLAPVPIPSVHDEFSYLLAADTFAQGRLANPPHQLWVFFDTFHVLVIVRYAPNHNPLDEWVYNAAEIDAAKVVWAREIPGRDPKPLLDYYRDRKIWLVNADASPPQLEPYHSDATAQSSH